MTTSRERARVRLAAERQAQTQRRRRRDRLVLAVVLAAVVFAVGLVGVAAQRSVTGGGSTGGDGGGALLPGRVSTEGGGVVYGQPGVPVLDMYEDFQCPACASLEQSTGATIRALASSGDVRVVFHPMSFLGPESDRASAAAGCAADAGRYLDFHRVLFANQPPERTGGYTTTDLVAFGARAGIEGAQHEAFEQCVRENRHSGWAADVDQQAGRAGVTATPTVLLDGRPLGPADLSPQALRRAVEVAGR